MEAKVELVVTVGHVTNNLSPHQKNPLRGRMNDIKSSYNPSIGNRLKTITRPFPIDHLPISQRTIQSVRQYWIGRRKSPLNPFGLRPLEYLNKQDTYSHGTYYYLNFSMHLKAATCITINASETSPRRG